MRTNSTFTYSSTCPKKAFSLIESAIVLGVAGLVIGGIWAAASAVNESMKWLQTEKGILYYQKLITDNFSIQNSAAIGVKDIPDWMAKFPLPAGWSCCGNYGAPIDPYGNPFYAQLQGNDSYWLGYYDVYLPAPMSKALCIKHQRLIRMRLNAINTVAWSTVPVACATDINACCTGGTGSSTSAYYKWP